MHYLFCDGGSRGNPGPAAYGYVICDQSGAICARWGDYLGETTNNVAEYMSLIEGVSAAKEYDTELTIYMDSALVVKQIRGEYKVKNETLKDLYKQATALLQALDTYKIHAIPRHKNTHADAQVNKVLDRY